MTNSQRERKKQVCFRAGGRILALLLVLLLLCGLSACGGGDEGGKGAVPDIAEATERQEVIDACADSMMTEVPDPGFRSVGGDWLIFGLVHSGTEVPEDYYGIYFDNLRAAVKSSRGVLSEDRYTEYVRAILGICAIGKDPREVEGYDLCPYLDDFEKLNEQGPTALCYALIAARSAGYALKEEERYVTTILEELADPRYMDDAEMGDYLAIGVEALSFYREREEVAAFIETALGQLSEWQQADGSMGNCESTAECILALTQMGLDPREDERFQKDGHSLLEGLMIYYLGDGAFYHVDLEGQEASRDPMSCEKALLALDALRLFDEGRVLYE